jgi:hypothetical protein
MPSSTSNMIAIWEEPPPATPGRKSRRDERAWPQLANDLMDRPRQWARLHDGLPRQAAYDINAARLVDFRPAGAFEAVTRGASIYVRFVGEDYR